MSDVKKIYLCKPNLSPICELNGVQTDSVELSTHVKDFDQLSFIVDRHININGKQVESNGYEYLNVAMYFYIEGYGFFRSEYPSLQNDGDSESKEITAYSIEKEVFNADWVGLKINTAEEDSQEMLIEGNVTGYAMPINLISFHNPYDPRFSLIEILISKIPLWSVGYIDPYIYRKRDDNGEFIQAVKKDEDGTDIPLTHTFSGTRWVYNEEGEFVQEEGTWTEPKYELRSVGVYDEDNVSIYSFLTSTLGPKIGALFFFDTEHRVIHALSKYFLENADATFDTGIYIGFRNLANSVQLSVDEDSIATRVNCSGDEDLTFLDLNYGSTRLIDLSYFAHEPYMTEETAAKVIAWQQMIEDARPEYRVLAEQAIDLNAEISEITYRVPSDEDYWQHWDDMNEEALNKSLAYFREELYVLQEAVDDTPRYDADGKYIPYNQGKTDEYYETKMVLAGHNFDGYGTYYEIVTYIIPNIEIALNNLTLLPTDPRYQDYIEQLNYDWELYGIVELEAQIKNLENQFRLLKDYYGNEWPATETEQAAVIMGANAWNKEYYNKQRQEYLKLNAAVGPNGTAFRQLDDLYRRRDGTDRLGNLISQEAYDASFKGRLSAIMEQMAPYKKYYDLSEWFTEEDLAQIYPLLIDTDYQNTNIAMQWTDTARSRVLVEQDLLDDCIDKVSEISQPQISFSSEVDNLYRIEEFKNLRKDLKLLNYIHLGVRDDYPVKLRVVGISWNPCDINQKLTIEFSNMITSRSGRSDFTDIINAENNRGQKNGISIGANGQISGSGDSIEYLTNLMEALAGTGMFKKSVKNTVSNPLTGVLNNVTQDEFMFALKTVPGISRFVLDASRVASLDTDDTIISGGRVKTGFINAKYIAVKQMMSATYEPSDTQGDVYSKVGTVIDLNNGSISSPNFAVDSQGNAYLKGNISAATGKIAGWIINGDKLYNSTYILDAGATTTTTINGTARQNLVLSIGNNFGVDSSGNLYANGSNIRGGITATSLAIENDVTIGTAPASGKTGINISTAGLLKASNAIIYGTIYASAGEIGKCSIDANGNLIVTTAHVSGTITANAINLGNGTFSVTTDGALTATSATITGKITTTDATIGGWKIDSNSIYYGTKSSGTGNGDITLMSSSVFNRTISGTSRTNLKFAIGSRFGVAQDGTLYAGSAVISGSITATSGTIGKCSIDANGNLIIPTANITGTITANAINLGSGVFQVGTGGALTATNANITGSINATAITAQDQYMIHGNAWGSQRSLQAIKMIYHIRYGSSSWGGIYVDNAVQIGDSGVHGIYIPTNVYATGEVRAQGWPCIKSDDYDGSYGLVHAVNIKLKDDGAAYVQVCGTGGVVGCDTFGSDRSLKKEIKDSKITALSIINSIQHREFLWKRNDLKVDLGYIAQELREVIPGSTFGVDQGNGSELLQISIPAIIPYITKAIQELSAQVDSLSNEVDELKAENAELRKMVLYENA